MAPFPCRHVLICLTFIIASALHLFAEQPRKRINFNTGWKFALGTRSDSPEESGFDDSEWEDVNIPHTLKMATAYLDSLDYKVETNLQYTFNRDVGWYRKHFTIDGMEDGKKMFLEFEGVMQVSEVWLNGSFIGKHEMCGYIPFIFDITDEVLVGEENVIAVRVDNNRNGTTPPDKSPDKVWSTGFDGFDFILFGGIYRDVYLHVTGDVYIQENYVGKEAGIRITFPEISSASATVRIETAVRNDRAEAVEILITADVFDPGGKLVVFGSTRDTVPAQSSAMSVIIPPAILSPELWSPEHPSLYTVEIRVSGNSALLDEKRTRIGLRWTEWSTTTGFSLNGEQYKLVGVNRHQAWPFVGDAVPNTVHYREAKQIKSIGANWIRLCHYPHDPAFLDAMDELGIMGLAEGPTWARSGSDPEWKRNLDTTWRQMIRRDRNRPSIIIWAANINHQGCAEWIRDLDHEEDPTRPAGQCDVNTDMCFWGSAKGDGNLCIEHTGHKYETARHDSEQRLVEHARRHWTMTNLSRANDENAGVAGWIMYDYNSFHNPPDRSNIVIHGIADLYRIPKFAFYWYRSELTEDPMVKIASYWNSDSPDDIVVFSNCEEIELSVNGKSKGRKTPSTADNASHLWHPPFEFSNVVFEPGTLTADCYIGNAHVLSETIRTPEAPVGLVLKTDADTLLANGSDFARITAHVVDRNGTVVADAENPITWTVTGAGRQVGDNPIKAVRGKIITLAQTMLEPGSMTVTAASDGLVGASITLTIIGDVTALDEPGRKSFSGCSVEGSFVRALMAVNGRNIILPSLPEWAEYMEIYDLKGKLLLKRSARDLRSVAVSELDDGGGIYLVRAVR